MKLRKKEQELVNQAIEYNGSALDGIYIISKHKLYDGFWGKNGFNDMIVLGYRWINSEQEIYHFDIECPRDVIQCFKNIQFSIDIPNEYDCIRLCFQEPIVVSKEQLSTFKID